MAQVIDWSTTVSEAVADSLVKVIQYVPKLLAAIIVILIGILVAWAIKTVIVRVLSVIKLKPYLDKAGLSKVFAAKVNFVELVGDLAKWIVVIVFLLPALEILNLTQVSDVLKDVVGYIPQVIVAVAIVMIGAIVADLVARVVEGTADTIGTKTSKVLADISRYAIMVFVVLAALVQLGIAATLIERLFTAIVAMLALAGGLAFGLGGQDAAKDVIGRIRKNMPR